MDNKGLMVDISDRRLQLGRFMRECHERIRPQAVGMLNLIETALIPVDHPCLRILLLLPQDTETIEKLQAIYDAYTAERAGRGSNGRLAVQPV